LKHESASLSGGRVWLLQHDLAVIVGTVSFGPARKAPYELSASVRVDDADASAFFGKAQAGQLPTVEGRFSLEGAVAGAGADLGGLVGAARQEIRLKSSGGILRLLKTNVADAIPEAPSPVSDTLGAVGSAVGSLFGVKSQSSNYGRNPVSKAADAVINLTYDISEFEFDKLAVTAERGP